MASTSITTVGGMVVVTQVIPKEESSIQLQAPPTADQAPPPIARAPPPEPVKVDEMTAQFLQGQPLGLGVVQIFIGVMLVLFSLTTFFWWTLIVHLPFGLAFFFIVSGSLSVASSRRLSVPLVWGCVASHALSSLVAVAGVCYVTVLMAAQTPYSTVCIAEDLEQQFQDPHQVWLRCTEQMWTLMTVLYGLLGLVLVLLVLQACVSISSLVFSARAASLRHSSRPLQTSGSDNDPLLAAS